MSVARAIAARLCSIALLGCALSLPSRPASAEFRCSTVRYAFQTDCFSPPCTEPKRKLDDRLDLGPQIAVWIESSDRSEFVDTLMVTNLTARYGVANRPGIYNLPSGPKQPYGKRLMALPIWAWARGKLYPQVVMQDGHEQWMGFHELISSPDPYYCRPMGLAEVDPDAISCPTKVFNSAKGRLAGELSKIPYPPRNDLDSFTDHDCDNVGGSAGICASSATTYATLNDLDAVAAATPNFGEIYQGRWRVPTTLVANRDYALYVEVNREFDQNPSYTFTAYDDKMLSGNGFTQTGLPNNLGQPSVVYRVPFRIDAAGNVGATAVISGFGDTDGATGAVHPPDSTISKSSGSGEGRLLTISSPFGGTATGKLFVKADDCGEGGGSVDLCSPLPAAPDAVTDVSVEPTATSAMIKFRHSGDDGLPVSAYDIRLSRGKAATDENFLEGAPVDTVDPETPGTMTSFEIRELKPLTDYVIAVRAVGRCGLQSPLAQQHFTTADQQFTQLTGCFVATAAYGSAMAPAVNTLRVLRDRARGGSALAAATIDLYERSSPPVAAVLRQSDGARALVRAVLAPAVSLAEALFPGAGK